MKLRIIKLCAVVGLIGIGCIAQPTYAVSSPSSLLLTRIEVGSSSDASDEVVQIINASQQAIDIKGLSIEYKAATGKSWTKKAVVSESRMLAPATTLSFASKQTHDIALTSGIAQAGGNIRIVFVGKTLDQVAWGTGDSPETKAVAAPQAGQALERQCSSVCVDSNNNEADFRLPAGDSSTQDEIDSIPRETNVSIEITELLPDPAAPQTDARDEFIELYNAGETEVLLVGWKLVSGSQTFKLDAVRIAASQYAALTSATTKLGLTNTGDSVSLIDASSAVIMVTPSYDTAKSGLSFGVVGGLWTWLDHPTPSAVNSAAWAEPVKATVEKSPKVSAKKNSTAAKKSTASAKSTSAKSVASAVKDAAKASSTENDSEPASSFSSAWVLAILGIFAIGYGVYEYRPELLSLYTRLRAKSQAGREPVKNRPARRRH